MKHKVKDVNTCILGILSPHTCMSCLRKKMDLHITEGML